MKKDLRMLNVAERLWRLRVVRALDESQFVPFILWTTCPCCARLREAILTWRKIDLKLRARKRKKA